MLAHRHFGLTVHPRLINHGTRRVSRNWSWPTVALIATCIAGLVAIT